MTDSLEKIQKQIRFLIVYAMASSILLLIALFLILKMDRKAGNLIVEELTAKRINIVESNGNPRLVLSNTEKSPENLNHGKPFGIPGGNRAGLIFFSRGRCLHRPLVFLLT